MSLDYPITVVSNVTFALALRCADPDVVSYAPIAAIAKSAPVQITTASAHNIPDGWPVWVESCVGMVEINNPRPTAGLNNDVNPPFIASVPSASAVVINSLNSTLWTTYRGSGQLAWQTPRDITAHTATLVVLDGKGVELFRVDSGVPSANGEVTVEPASYTVGMRIDVAAQTLLNDTAMTYQLIMTDVLDDNRTYLLIGGALRKA